MKFKGFLSYNREKDTLEQPRNEERPRCSPGGHRSVPKRDRQRCRAPGIRLLPGTAAPKKGRDPQNLATLTRPRAPSAAGEPRTAAAPGPRPHRSWSSIAAAAAGPRQRRAPRHPQQGPASRAHLVAEQLPHVHRTHRAPPPAACRKPPGPRDTCRKAGSAGRAAGAPHCRKARRRAPCRKGRGGEAPHCRKAARRCREGERGHRGRSRVPGRGSGLPGAARHRAGRGRERDTPAGIGALATGEAGTGAAVPAVPRGRALLSPAGEATPRSPGTAGSAFSRGTFPISFQRRCAVMAAHGRLRSRCRLETRQELRCQCGSDEPPCNSTRCRTPHRLRRFSI